MPDQVFLEPDEGYFSSYTFCHNYHRLVRDILLEHADDTPLARMVELASFTPEYAISLEESKSDLFLVRYECSAPLWDNKKPEDVNVAMKRAKLDKKISALIHQVFFSAVSLTRYADQTSGLDGGYHYFCAFRQYFGLRSGQVWSPDENTLTGELVSYAYLMNDYVDTTESEQGDIKSRLERDGMELLAKLENAT